MKTLNHLRVYAAAAALSCGLLGTSARGDQTVPATAVGDGEAKIVLDQGVITTTSSSAEVIKVDAGGGLILWARTRVNLKPGVHAYEGSFFWAAVDSDMDGYSDEEMLTDSDGDSIPDAWETDHGMNPGNYADAFADRNSDGVVNLQEYFASLPSSLPTGASLILRMPSGKYFSLETSTWSLRPTQ